MKSGRTYLRHINTIWLKWKPKKLKGRLDKLTVESRMLGELWCDVEDHG